MLRPESCGCVFLRVCGLFAVGVESGSCVAEFCEAFNLFAVIMREGSVHFLGFRCRISLRNWPVFLR